MKEKRSLFSMIFGIGKQDSTITTQLKMLNNFMPIFTPFGDEAYNSDVVRGAVDAIARNAAKLKPKHVRRQDGQVMPQDSSLDQLLQIRPNPFMDAYTFYYKVITSLYMKNNSFIYIDIEPTSGKIQGFYPINSQYIELLESQGEIYVKFRFLGGDIITLPYSNIIHLRRYFYTHDFYGEPNEVALNPTLELICTTNQGIVNAIKSSAVLRGILKFTAMLKPSDIKAERDRFVNEYLSVDNNGGVGAIDAKADFIETKANPKLINTSQMELINDKVYKYFGVNEAIVTSKYTEDEWSAFYESVIEPLAIQMSLEFTSKLFTDRERGFGNEIVFESNRLQYASNTTKTTLISTLMPLGLLTVNEGREILNLAPVEDGDKRLVSLNFVNADKADQYQLGSDNLKNGS